MKRVKVISGLHKGLVGRVVAEKDFSYEIKNGSKIAIVAKERCAPYSGEEVEMESKRSSKGKVLQFKPRMVAKV
jgi:RNase P/RNase MRP subunit p29